IVVEMPFNLAFFGIDAATGVMDAFPAVTSWWIGGHSLGGSMAAQYAAAHSDTLSGLVLLGAYSASDLSQTNLKNLTVYGENDQVINRDKLAAAASDLMPKDAPCFGTPSVIPGGNHAYFGNYGQQSGDGEASITPEQQWSKTAELMDAAMRTPQACGN
ncbi:MAG: alpha/beta hydrolase, partial [Raoultibacter sp.]